MKYACIQVCRLAFLHSIAFMGSSYMSTLLSYFSNHFLSSYSLTQLNLYQDRHWLCSLFAHVTTKAIEVLISNVSSRSLSLGGEKDSLSKNPCASRQRSRSDRPLPDAVSQRLSSSCDFLIITK